MGVIPTLAQACPSRTDGPKRRHNASLGGLHPDAVPGSSERHPRAALTEEPRAAGRRGSALCCPRAPAHPISPANSWPPSMPSVHTAQKGGPDAPGQWVLLDTLQAGDRAGRAPTCSMCPPPPLQEELKKMHTIVFQELVWHTAVHEHTRMCTHPCVYTHVHTHMYVPICTVMPHTHSCVHTAHGSP